MKLKATYQTEVFISQGGYIVIRQEDNFGEEESIILSPDQAELIAVELQKLADSRGEWWSLDEPEEDEEPVPPKPSPSAAPAETADADPVKQGDTRPLLNS